MQDAKSGSDLQVLEGLIIYKALVESFLISNL